MNSGVFSRVCTVWCLEYLAGVLLSLLIAVWAFQLSWQNLPVPFVYERDAYFHALCIKATAENGWFFTNPRLGAPFEQQLYDFPAYHYLPVAMIKLISWFLPGFGLSMNVFYLVSFPLITLSGLGVLRHFNVSYGPALLASLLYTCLPYRFIMYQHLFMSAYYMVPLAIMVILWVCSDGAVFYPAGKNGSERKFTLCSLRGILAILVCVFLALDGVYYSFFACMLMLPAAALAAVTRRTPRHLIAAVILVGFIGSSTALALSPHLIYQVKQGPNPRAMARSAGPSDAETFGLKLVQMLLPGEGHRVPCLANLGKWYVASVPRAETNGNCYIGLLAGTGYLFLIGRLLLGTTAVPRGGRDSVTDELTTHLCRLNLLATLLGIVGGFSSLIAVVGFTAVRCYYRLSIFIGFFSLFAAAILLDRAMVHWRRQRPRSLLPIVVVVVGIAGGVLDQTSPRFVPAYATVGDEYRSDADFIGLVENRLPKAAMVYQLPYRAFLTGPCIFGWGYDHLKGYLHSDKLRWSFGAMDGRREDLWEARIAGMEPADMIGTLARAGFMGIYLDRKGYDYRSEQVEAALVKVIGTPPIVSRNARLVFFDLRDYVAVLKSARRGGDWETETNEAMHPVLVDWASGFYWAESWEGHVFRWCDGSGSIRLINSSGRPRKVSLEMSLATACRGPWTLRLDGPGISEKLRVDQEPLPYVRAVGLPPGEHLVNVICEAPPINPGRRLVFQVRDFRVVEQQ
jgi:phosphoglycerol transferase